MTDPLNLDDLRALLKAADYQGPLVVYENWPGKPAGRISSDGGKTWYTAYSPAWTGAGASLIVAAVNALPQLLDKIKYMHAALTMENEGRKRLEAEVERLRGLLQEVLMDKTVGMTLGEAADLDARIAAACGEVKP